MSEEQKPLETTLENIKSSSGQMGETKPEPSVDPKFESNSPTNEDKNEEPFTDSASESLSPEAIMTSLQQEVAMLSQQLDEQTQQAEANKKRYINLAAEFDNFRKRTQKEKEDLEIQIKCKTIAELLPVIDNFDRARTQLKPATDGEMGIHKSYQSVYKNFVDGLKRLGVSAMRPEGQPFDPTYHEAMLREYTDDYPEGTVIEQLIRGYLLGDQVLRHAMVKVAAAKDPDQTSESTENYSSSSYSETSDSSSM
ncbi:nucleotide exchange factor GrpE [Aphanothece hegewaldii CCALA 016]|uniref:Protein GrpE n=1 Tax=Aphanothece hegewaldii CCALA 016 TaxID=2107694 RepID=A0A2T1LZ57_9CHRO|nr:nucleotide exchange factor GrpE [Aphanothece hegewaldii]PSF37673.1 nucleotide exchange factor GrpE [Aphanothece hegewaldii CCALA 016]